jgi:von Willebrand factor type A domain
MIRIETVRSRTRRSLFVTLLGASGALPQIAACGARSGLDFPEASGISAATPAGSSPSSSAGAPPGSQNCESITVELSDLRPAVTLLVDQSGSMAFRYPNSDSPETRWSLVRNALFDPQSGVVKTFEHSVRFGIAFFTSHNGFSGGACPLLSEVSAATDNYDALRALYYRLQPDDDTPTGAAIQKIVTELESPMVRGPQSIVVVTDGDADTCEVPDPQQGEPEALAATERAFAAGIEVSVLGISSDIAEQNLQGLANAGKGRPIAAVWGVDANAAQPFHASDDVRGLTAQLVEILGRIPLCTVPLQRDLVGDEIKGSRVLLDGQSLVYGSADGFAVKDARHLEIVGQACATLKASGKQVSVRISCD